MELRTSRAALAKYQLAEWFHSSQRILFWASSSPWSRSFSISSRSAWLACWPWCQAKIWQKHTAASIRWWSPTQLLIGRYAGYHGWSDGKPISRLSRRKGSIFDLVWWRRFWMWRAKGSLNLACQSSVSSILPHSQDRAMGKEHGGKEHGGKEHGGMRSGHGASLLRSRFRILWSKTLFPCFLPKSLLENIIIELNRSEQMSRRIKVKQSSKAPGQYDGTQKSDDAFRNVVMDRVFKKELLSTKKRWQA